MKTTSEQNPILKAVKEHLDGDLRGWKVQHADIIATNFEYGGSLTITKPTTHWLNAEIIANLYGSNLEINCGGVKTFDLCSPTSLDDIKNYLQILIAYKFDD